MSFPKKFLGIFPVGWKDLGKIDSTYVDEKSVSVLMHDFCKRVIHIGKEDGKLFTFCPRCMIQTKKGEK